MLAANRGAIIILAVYYLGFIALLLILRLVIPSRKELIRKGYHLFCSLSILILMYVFESWQAAALTVTAFFLVALIYLFVEEKFLPRKLFDLDRKDSYSLREPSRQVLLVLAMQLLLIFAFRAILFRPIHAVIGMMVWGTGDAAAAVIGSNLGRTKFSGLIMSSRKTLEGTLALVGAAFFTSIMVILLSKTLIYSVPVLLLKAGLIALAAALVEGASRQGFDTLTMPLAVAVVSLLFQIIISAL